MNLRERWDKAVNQTDVVRWRKTHLATFDKTVLKYAFLGESLVNAGDTIQRQGRIVVHRPMLLLPENIPQFEGFDALEDLGIDEDDLAKFLLIRGISFPSLKYQNETSSLDLVEKPLDDATDNLLTKLDKENNADTGVLVGPEDCWQFSVIIYASGLMGRSASRDINRLLE